MLVSKSIPSLFNGVSQQPATLRGDTQGELSENCYPAIATGLRKRPPLTHLAKLTVGPIGAATAHVINRDTSERYAVFVASGGLSVFSLLDGSPRTVNYPSGASYLVASDPTSAFSLVTVADYTFILNKTVTVQQTGISAGKPGYVAYFNVISYQTSVVYSITVDGLTGTYTTNEDSHDATWVADRLAEQLVTALGSGYAVGRVPDTALIRVEKLSGLISSAGCYDGFGNTATLDMFNDVQRFSQLPTKFDPGYTIKIIGDPNTGNSSYYVEFKNGGWVETIAPGVYTQLDPATMPHKLVREADGTFTFAPIDWAPRKVGDDESVPAPSFVGRTISAVFYYRSRLGFLADESVCLSRSGEYYNFWGKSATAVLDTDPVDTNVGTTKVSILKHAVPFDKSLLLFSDQTQFQLTGGQESLTPKSVKADVATEFDSGTAARPVGIGQAVYFGVVTSGHTGVREYYVDATTLTNEAADITAHVPNYLPSGLFHFAASSAEDCLFGLFRSEPNAVYVYKFYWEGNTKAQSAWCKFVFSAGCSVLAAEFIGNRCYFIVNRGDGAYLEVMDLQADAVDPAMSFQVLLDRKVTTYGTYDAGSNKTTWVLPYAPVGSSYALVLSQDFSKKVGMKVDFTYVGGTSIQADGNFSGGRAYFGEAYTQRYRFSTQYVKDQNKVAMTNGKLKIRRFYLDYSSSGYFRVEVQPQARDTYTYVFSGKALGTPSAIIGQPPIQTGTFSFPVLTSNLGVRIDILNDSHLPATFQSAGWEGEFVSFGRRM